MDAGKGMGDAARRQIWFCMRAASVPICGEPEIMCFREVCVCGMNVCMRTPAPIPGSVRRSVAVMAGQTGREWKSRVVHPAEPVPELFWW